MFVIWNLSAWKYVAPAGSASSYTASLERARKFATREAAERECCGDERVRDVADILRGRT